MSNENKDYIVLKMHLAGWLMMKGYVLKEIKPTNKEGSVRNVFIFNKTKSLLNSIEEYKQSQLIK